MNALAPGSSLTDHSIGVWLNLLDTKNFGTPAANISNSNAGVITTADEPRNVQLSVRMVW